MAPHNPAGSLPLSGLAVPLPKTSPALPRPHRSWMHFAHYALPGRRVAIQTAGHPTLPRLGQHEADIAAEQRPTIDRRAGPPPDKLVGAWIFFRQTNDQLWDKAVIPTWSVGRPLPAEADVNACVLDSRRRMATVASGFTRPQQFDGMLIASLCICLRGFLGRALTGSAT